MKKQRVAKVMAAAGIASRRRCEEMIFDGEVSVNGEKILLPQTLVDPFKDTVAVNGTPIPMPESKHYFLLNKPKGYLCTSCQRDDVRIVLHLFPEIQTRLFTAGRLDKNTSGLLIVTNDGEFANRVIHPSSNIQKEYLVKVNLDISDAHLKEIAKGMKLEGTLVKPVKVKKVRRGTLKVVVTEGKKREVRLLCKKAGLVVKELTRIRIGGLTLGNLPPGRYRSLTAQDKEALFS